MADRKPGEAPLGDALFDKVQEAQAGLTVAVEVVFERMVLDMVNKIDSRQEREQTGNRNATSDHHPLAFEGDRRARDSQLWSEAGCGAW